MIKSQIIIIVFFSLFFGSCILAQSGNGNFNYKPEDGYVPNQETAITIAEAIWLPVYGDKIYDSKPFKAKLKNGIWIVEGTIHTTHGGGPYIEIRKSDCKIMKMYHGK